MAAYLNCFDETAEKNKKEVAKLVNDILRPAEKNVIAAAVGKMHRGIINTFGSHFALSNYLIVTECRIVYWERTLASEDVWSFDYYDIRAIDRWVRATNRYSLSIELVRGKTIYIDLKTSEQRTRELCDEANRRMNAAASDRRRQ